MFLCADHICNSHLWAKENNENITAFSPDKSSIFKNEPELRDYFDARVDHYGVSRFSVARNLGAGVTV